MTTQNLYDILGCNTDSTQSQILAEFRVRVLDVHPDKCSNIAADTKLLAEEKFHLLNRAKEILTTPALKQHYDLYLKINNNDISMNMNLNEWMTNCETLQQTIHWAQMVPPNIRMLQSNTNINNQQTKQQQQSSCKSELEEDFVKTNEYPRRFAGWQSHSSPLISAFRNYQI